MAARNGQENTAECDARNGWRLRASHTRMFAAAVLCMLLAAPPVHGSLSPGRLAEAERPSAARIGEIATRDRAPSHTSSPVDPSVTAPTTPGQTVIVTSPATPADPVPPVVVSALAGDGIPLVAMRAYQHAADLANQHNVNCAVPWTLLAAIGRVESDHGRFGGLGAAC
jgi:hypothetical protein